MATWPPSRTSITIAPINGATQYGDVPTSDSSYSIDITSGPGQPVKVTKNPPALFPRSFQNSILLPSGEVVTVGGQSYATLFSDSTAVLMAEIWSPVTGARTRLAAMSVPRSYHSLALLMADGRILAAGGGLCNCGANHQDMQILTPPYLYASSGVLASRPVITNAPTSATRGGTLSMTVDRAVTSFALVRISSVTHTTNNDQRRVPLVAASSHGTTYQLTLPSDPGVLLPGPWMLFAMDAKGVPSVAKIVSIQ